MQQKAIKTTWNAGEFNSIAMSALLIQITAALTDCGCTIVGNSADHVEWMPAGCNPTDDTDDDTPHWTMVNVDEHLQVCCVHGASYDDPNARKSLSDYFSPPVSVVGAETRFYCNSSGFWWISTRDPADPTADLGTCVGTRLVRYPADTTQGVYARYGLLRTAFYDGLQWCPPYYLDQAGDVVQSVAVEIWSPICSTDQYNLQNPTRHSGSPFAACAAPIWPRHTDASKYSACLLGEMEGVQLLTDNDFTLEQVISPGWIALPNTVRRPGIAVPASAFTVLPDPR